MATPKFTPGEWKANGKYVDFGTDEMAWCEVTPCGENLRPSSVVRWCPDSFFLGSVEPVAVARPGFTT